MRIDYEIREPGPKQMGVGFMDAVNRIAFLAARIPIVTSCGVASIVLFMASLTQDCFFIDRAENPRAWSSGFGLLMTGWLAVFFGVVAWLANPTLLVAWLAMWSPNHKKYSIGASTIALLLALSFLLHESLVTDEAGNRSRITGYGIGYWLWVGSTVIALIGSCSWLGNLSLELKAKRSRVRFVATAIGLAFFAGAAIAGFLLSGVFLGLAAAYSVKSICEFYCEVD